MLWRLVLRPAAAWSESVLRPSTPDSGVVGFQHPAARLLFPGVSCASDKQPAHQAGWRRRVGGDARPGPNPWRLPRRTSSRRAVACERTSSGACIRDRAAATSCLSLPCPSAATTSAARRGSRCSFVRGGRRRHASGFGPAACPRGMAARAPGACELRLVRIVMSRAVGLPVRPRTQGPSRRSASCASCWGRRRPGRRGSPRSPPYDSCCVTSGL